MWSARRVSTVMKKIRRGASSATRGPQPARRRIERRKLRRRMRAGHPTIRAVLIHPDNPRYFSDGGRPVYLTGSHHWDVLLDNGERPGGFDFEGYLNRLESWG